VTGRLAPVVTGQVPPGLYRWRSRAHHHALRRELAGAGWGIYPLPGNQLTGTGRLLDAYARALSFPAWFGHNWHALTDCLTDLSWLPARGHVVLWEQHGVLPGHDAKAWRQAFEVLSHAIAVRSADASPPLFVLLRGTGPVRSPLDGAPIPVLEIAGRR
jgi:hypothetical protein